MGVSAVIRDPEVTVDPGRDARRQVVVRNTGSVVDQFVLTVRGDAAGWSRIHPETINLLPNEETVAELVFSPPRDHHVGAGDYPYAVRVLSREDEAGSAVHEGTVTVTGFTDIDAQVVPHNAHGRRSGRTTLAVDNLGNYRQNVTVLGYDEDNALIFTFRPRSVSTVPGTATFVRVKPKPRKYFWKGADRPVPYQLDVRPADGEPVVVDGMFTQKPLLPRRTLFILPVLIALLMILAIVVSSLRQQTPTSEAGPSPEVVSTSASATSTTAAPTTVVPGSSVTATGTGGGATTGTPGVGTEAAAGTVTIDADAYPGAAGTYQEFGYVVPPGRTISVTAVRLRDAGTGEQGTAQVRAPDGTVLLSRDLATLTTEYDYTFGTPLILGSGQQITLAVDCRDTTNVCDPTATFAEGPIG